MLAGEWHLVGELNQWLESLLPAGTPAIPARAPLIGWLTLTVGCAMWLTYDWHRDRNSGARLWTRVMYLTPFMAALQGLIAAICASSIQFFFFEGLRLR
jgi:hypothetical protein